jgi:hypothetical protein
MNDKPVTSVHQYVAACEILQREAKLAIDDHTAIVENKPAIRYVVDFSEVYAFAFPRETAVRMRLFNDEDEQTSELLQRDALENLFFRTPEATVLLPPYAIELQSLIAKLRVGHFDRLIREMDQAARDIERVVQVKEVQDLLAELQGGQELSAEKLQHALAVFERHATHLLLLHQHRGDVPLKKITRLVQSERIIPLAEKLVKVEPDEETRDRWYQKLTERRGHEHTGSSYIDAVAMGMLAALNRRLEPENVRLIFVTRSDHMHAVFQEEYDAGLWSHHILRHPRSFTSLFRRHQSGTDVIEQLKNRQASLDLFVSGTKPRVDANEPLGADPTFMQQLKSIREEWLLSGVLAASPGTNDAADGDSETRVHATRRKVMDIVRLLTQREAFSELLDQRLNDLMEALERRHEFLGFYVQSSTAEEKDVLENDIRARLDEANHAILACKRYWVPHTIQFTSPKLTEWARALEHDSEITWIEIMNFLRENFSGEAEYERLLAMAYLLASLKKWELAERFCRRALLLPIGKSADLSSQMHRHEAWFLLAICHRMHQRSPVRHKLAFEYLDKATILRQWRSDVPKSRAGKIQDPRYLTERAAHIFRWNLTHRTPPSDEWKQPPPFPITKALELWSEALALSKDNSRLQAQIHNNICFYYCEAVKKPNEKKIREHLEAMLHAQSQIEPDPGRWPPQLVDTIAMARLRLYKTHRDATELIAAENNLRERLKGDDLLEDDRERYERHLETIRRELAAADTPRETFVLAHGHVDGHEDGLENHRGDVAVLE